MRKNNGHKGIKNLKVTSACIGTVILIGVSVYSLYKEDQSHEFKYIITEDGSIEREGTVSYEDICRNWRLIEKKLINGKSKLFIVDKNMFDNCGHDIQTGKTITNSTDFKTNGVYYDSTVLNAQKLNEYLLAYDMVKGRYSSEDIDMLLSMIEADYEYHNDKELIKE